MLWRRAATVGLTALALLAAAQPAGAVTYVGLHDLTCEGATTEGTGMPRRAALEVAVVDPASDRVLSRGRVTTSASGTTGSSGSGGAGPPRMLIVGSTGSSGAAVPASRSSRSPASRCPGSRAVARS